MKKNLSFSAFVAVLILIPAILVCQMPSNRLIKDTGKQNTEMLSGNALSDSYAPADHSARHPKDKKFRDDYIAPGQDLWTVPCATFSFGEDGDYPGLPPDFFGPGSDPFDGLIQMEGSNSNGSQEPHADIFLQRNAEGFFSEPLPSTTEVPIEIIEIKLKSLEPVQVSFNGVPDSFFDVFFDFNVAAVNGGMDVIVKEHIHGGSFTKEFNFYPVITFSEVGNPGNQYVFNPFDMGMNPLDYFSAGSYPWTLSPIPNEFDPIGDDPMVMSSLSGTFIKMIPLLQRHDFSFLDMSETGEPLVWEGTGYAAGEWFYYPNTDWWNVWFYDHPIAPDRKKIIEGMLMIEPRFPDIPTYVEIVFNWSTPEWPGFPEMGRPPLPSDVQDPMIEEMMIVRSETQFVYDGNLFEPIPVPINFEVLEYNPEWLSIDLRGFNFVLIADLQHTCWKEGDCGELGYDFGDAPENALAYINGTIGQFPTCMNTGPAGSFVSHAQPSGLFFGGLVDVEMEGNAGTCPMFHPNNYNVDECGTYPYPLPPPNWLDEGLMYPIPLTIIGTAGNEQYTPCGQQTMPLGSVCDYAFWGQDLDIWVDASQSQGGYLNVLFDWDQNGVWMGASTCQPPINPNDYVPEHAVQNLQIPAGFVGPVSLLNPQYAFQIGPNPGYVWARFSLTDVPVPMEWDGSGVFAYGETEDYLIEISGSAQGNLDFGDAPDPSYPTLLANDGARHTIDGVTFLGASVDPDPDGQQDPNALGDDNDGNNDDDGIVFGPIMTGSAAQLNVTTSVSGILQGWMDFNGDGDWDDPGEQIFVEEYIHFGGTRCLNYFVPANAVVGNTFARFRFSTQPGLTYTGLAPDGEVEDYMVEIIENPELKWIQEPCEYLSGLHCHDYTLEGEYTYPVLADDWICGGGAVTKIQWWGNYEVDDLGNEKRFEGIDHFHLSIHAHNPDGCLPVDPEIWGVDVPFSSLNEQFIGMVNNEGCNIYFYEYVLPQPFNQIEGTQYWLDITAVSVNPMAAPQWRWQESDRSTSTVLCPAAGKWNAPWGHISWSTPEPVRFSEMAFALISEYIDEYDFGDAPDQPYPTLLANDGARHIIDPDVYLGNLIDAEPDGQPTAGADGDDLNNLDDEDGVTFKPVVAGQMATVKVIASVDGFLNAWLDFNMNGSWADAGDQIFNDKPLSAGINNLTFSVPAGIDPGATYARFRFNTAGGLNHYGLAQDGEVEDYRVVIYPEGWGFTPTGSTHVIAVPLNVSFNCITLAAGDFLGTFYTDDDGDLICGGAVMWDALNNQVVVAYGDDQTTPEKDGFDDGEAFTWKVYYTNTGTEEEVNVAYDNSLPDSSGEFVTNGLSALTDVTKPMFVTATADSDTICEGDQVQLDATVTGGCGPVSYSWSSSPAGFTSNIKNPSDNPAVTTIYNVQVSNNYGDLQTASVQVVVHPLPPVDCPPFMEACDGDPLVVLNSASPQGGQYSGVGVSFNGTNYVFDPGAGPGVYVITYCYTDADTGCTACCEFDFIVHALPDVDCPDDMTVCVDTDPFDLTGATPTGGNYSGAGVSGGKFYPATAGAGDHLITYTYTDPQTLCTNFCEFIITVVTVEVECPDSFAVCLDDDPVTLTGGSPAGGTYNGPGVSGGVFSPAAAGVGVHVISYSYVYPGTNCAGSCTFEIEVYPLPPVDCPPNMEACVGDPLVVLNSASPQGGQYSGIGVSFNGTNYVFDPGAGPGVYVITYCYTDADTGCTACCEFDFYVKPSHIVSIFEGWSGISSYIIPGDPDLDVMLDPIMDELIILSNFDGMYWPGGNTYTIDTWDEYSGYAIKVNDDTELPVCGAEITNKTVQLNAGWNLVPVLSSTQVNVVNLFSGVNGFQIAKEVAGTGIYWPLFAINTIGNFDPGKAYFVRMSTSGSIDYSSVKTASSIKPTDISNLITPWNSLAPTPGSHVVVFNLTSSPLVNGDIIGGFTAGAYCSGIALVEHADKPLGISLYGNDPFSDIKAGFASGEMINFRVYRPSTGETFDLEVSYNPMMNTGYFETHGLSEVNMAKLSATSVGETNISSINVFPNPSGGKFIIDGISGYADVSIFNAHGKEILNKSLFLPTEVDLSAQPRGIYFLRVEKEENVFFEKLIRN